jgi:hypothetical protein
MFVSLIKTLLKLKLLFPTPPQIEELVVHKITHCEGIG